tara:strand:- start:468 stop:818 length:351 start_codon:yes stop_codon:yes gene_type:complete
MIKKIAMATAGIALGIYGVGYLGGQEWAQKIEIPGGVATVASAIGFVIAAKTTGDVSKVAFLAGAGALAPVALGYVASMSAEETVVSDHRTPSLALASYHNTRGSMLSSYVDSRSA